MDSALNACLNLTKGHVEVLGNFSNDGSEYLDRQKGVIGEGINAQRKTCKNANAKRSGYEHDFRVGIIRSAKSEMGRILRLKGRAGCQGHVTGFFVQNGQVQADERILEAVDALKLGEDDNANEAPLIRKWEHPSGLTSLEERRNL